jgi:hypothetical protein
VGCHYKEEYGSLSVSKDAMPHAFLADGNGKSGYERGQDFFKSFAPLLSNKKGARISAYSF